MRRSCVFILCSILVCLALGCRSGKQEATVIPVNLPKVITKVVKVPVRADSALLIAWLACDSNNKVILKAFNDIKSTGMETQLNIDSTGKLQYKSKKKADTVYIEGKDSLIYIPVPGKTVTTNILTGWQWFWVRLGQLALIALFIWKLPALINLFKKYILKL
jgi:hypothetical protein